MNETWLNFLPNWMTRPLHFLGDVGGAALFATMLLTVIDIVARNLGFGSIEAIVELTTYGVVISATFGLAITTALGGHIIIDLFTRNNRPRTNRIIDGFWLAVAAIIITTVSWFALKEGLTLHASGTRTEVLEWSPLVPHLPAAFGWLVGAILAGWIAVSVVHRIFVAQNYKEVEDILTADINQND
jgi:TRAP-type C4-dicarboxylate transport system permease small subunit